MNTCMELVGSHRRLAFPIIPGLVPGVLVPDVTLTWSNLVQTLTFSVCCSQDSTVQQDQKERLR
eukprot:1156584-Pelagomonas_calceolata.AAC.10